MSKTDINTGSEQLLAYEQDGVAVLTLNRPEARNAMSGPMMQGLQKALDYAERSRSVRALVLTGAGNAFCAGGDVKGMAARSQGASNEELPSLDERIHLQRLDQRNTAGRIFKMPKPVVSMIPGPAAGAGLSLALAADLRTMANDTFITTAFAKVGFSGDYGGTFFLSHLVGLGRAKEMYYLSDRYTAQQCLAIGVANFIYPPEELEARTLELARRLALGPPLAYRYMKENFNRAAMGADVIDCLDLEATHHVHLGQSADHKGAAKAFTEKRAPEFNGR